MEELKKMFDSLPDEKKLEFIKTAIPDLCRLYQKNPQEMMEKMMPVCREMMKECPVDMGEMMSMFNMMNFNRGQ